MKITKAKFICAILMCGLATTSLVVPNAHAQQGNSVAAPDGMENAPVATTERSETVERDKVRTSAEHIYNSPAERANDDLLVTEVKSALAERGISDEYPVAVDCDHGTIQLSGVVASADEARQAEALASNTKGVVGVKNRLTWR
jgi:osmotically-inducible protein OsmY